MVGVAVNVTRLPEQILLAEAEILTEGTGAGCTVMVTGVLVTVGCDGQTAFDVNATVIASPLLKVALENVALLVPAGVPLTNHWNTGEEPPLMAVAVKFTLVPGHMVVADAATETDGTTWSFTVMVMVLLVTTAGTGQVAEEVSTTVTLSALFKPDEVKFGLLVPTFAPFTCHW